MVDGRSKAKVVGSVVACEAAGGIGALLSRQGLREWYSTLRKPSFTPPGSYFGPTWTLLYHQKWVYTGIFGSTKRVAFSDSCGVVFLDSRRDNDPLVV